MTKKTKQHRKYEQLAKRLSLIIGRSGKQSVRKLAQFINGAKSSVHRHLRAQKRRNQHPESFFWETEAGSAWLRLLVFAVLYLFGLECGVGARKLSRFFKLIRIHHHVGVSEAALRTRMQQMELLLPQFQEACEQQVTKQKRKVVVAMDETFFGDFLILVLMDCKRPVLPILSNPSYLSFSIIFGAKGSNSSIRLFGQVGNFSRVSFSHSSGFKPFSLAVPSKV